ncbi:MAG TPA: DUF4388 domain-containing protein [Polyangiaceae bacterium]|nr:DUF4388 domain-containing protein [Polyangiaceae bacterium]
MSLDGPVPALQGPAAPEPPGEAAPAAQFAGALEELSVADLIQILQLAAKSAAVLVTHDGGESRLWCSAGEIVDAESGRLRGEAAVYRILGFERGYMSADLRPAERPRSIFAGTQRLLLEAARRKDESLGLLQKLGAPDRAYRLPDGHKADPLGLSAQQLGLLHSFIEPRSVGEVLEASELGDFETLTALACWVESGHLVDAGSRPRLPRDPRPPIVSIGHSLDGTLRPLMASTTPAARSAGSAGFASWAWVAAAVLALTPAGYLLGSRTRHAPELAAPAPLLPALAVAAPISDPAVYELDLRVEPAGAEIWLDRDQASIGQLRAELARDGRPHELRVEAPGFQPLTILFVDTAPPRELKLEPEAPPASAPPQPARAVAPTASTASAASEPPTPATVESAKVRKRAVPLRPPQRSAPRPAPRVRPHALGNLREANAQQGAPRSANEPVVRVLD